MPTVPDIHRRGTRADQATVASPPLTVGTLYFVTDEGVTERWDGAAWQGYSGAGIGAPPPPNSPGATLTTFLVSGGAVVWESAYTFRVSAADYYINGTRYTSPEATATLAAAHATLDRLDVIALTTAGAVIVLPGTAASTPSEPSVDPAQYLKLAIVLVAHATVAPPDVQTMTVYAEAVGPPLEWTWTSSGASIVVNATTTPHAGTKTIEGTNVVAGVYAQGTIGSGSIDPTDYDHLLLFLRSKAAWNSSRGLLVTLRLSGVLVGAAVQIRRSGTFGFDSTLTTDYQMVAIPIPAFAVPQGSAITQVRVEDFGGAIGFFLDDVSFQAAATTPVGGGLTQDQADARYAPLVHAPRHSAGAADAVTVTALAGYPGGTTTFLRADGTFAAPSAGAPGAHHTTHEAGGADAIKLDDLAAPDDTTDLNASAGAHGLLRKLDGLTTTFLRGDGTWATPAAGTPSAHHASHETGGADAIVALSGSVITTGTVAAARLDTHKTSHETGGSDAITALAASVITTGTIASARLPARVGAVGLVIDGGGSVITTGVKGFVEVPFACTITAVTLLSTDAAVTSGSIVIDIWKDSYANYPPVVGDAITASAKPTLSSATKSRDTTLTGWTTAIAAGDMLGFSVTSVTTLTRVALSLTVQAT